MSVVQTGTELDFHNSVTAVTSPVRTSFCMVSGPAHGETGADMNGRGNSHE